MNRRHSIQSILALSTMLPTLTAFSQSQRSISEVSIEVGWNGEILHVPHQSQRVGAVLILHGSEGGQNGNSRWLAQWLSSYGYLTMAINYSKGGNSWHAGDIHRTPLERTAEAMDWLSKHSKCNGKVGLCGYSRGAEHALLLTSILAIEGGGNLPKAVAVHASSDVVARDFVSASVLPIEPKPWPNVSPAWTWKGREISTGIPIEIERFNGPLLLSHGELDDVWSVQRTKNLEKRLRTAGRDPVVRYFPSEKHGLSASSRTLLMKEWADFFSRHLT